MKQASITVNGSSDLDLMTRQNAIEEINKLPTDQLKRLTELSKIPKAKSYLESALKFTALKAMLG